MTNAKPGSGTARPSASGGNGQGKEKTPARQAVPQPRPYYLVGSVLLVLALASLVWLYLVALGGGPLEHLIPFLKEDFSYIAIPGVLLLLAGVPLFFAEMFRRGRLSERSRTFLQGGSVGLQLNATPLRYALLWMVVPAVSYAALVPVATLAERGDSAWGTTLHGASEDFWSLVFFYGFVAAGVVGVFLASFLKRATYRTLAARNPDAGASGFWRLVATQWRAETWFSFVSAGLFGVLPFLGHDALAKDRPYDGTAFAVMGGLAVAFAVLALVTVLNAWRSGDPYGFSESVA